MPVYVDTLRDYGWRLGPSCHLIADSRDELHAFAAKLGMKRSWFQKSNNGDVPHYDLTASKRKKAVELGAVELTLRQFGDKIWDYITSRKARLEWRFGRKLKAEPLEDCPKCKGRGSVALRLSITDTNKLTLRPCMCTEFIADLDRKLIIKAMSSVAKDMKREFAEAHAAGRQHPMVEGAVNFVNMWRQLVKNNNSKKHPIYPPKR